MSSHIYRYTWDVSEYGVGTQTHDSGRAVTVRRGATIETATAVLSTPEFDRTPPDQDDEHRMSVRFSVTGLVSTDPMAWVFGPVSHRKRVDATCHRWNFRPASPDPTGCQIRLSGVFDPKRSRWRRAFGDPICPVRTRRVAGKDATSRRDGDVSAPRRRLSDPPRPRQPVVRLVEPGPGRGRSGDGLERVPAGVRVIRRHTSVRRVAHTRRTRRSAAGRSRHVFPRYSGILSTIAASGIAQYTQNL